MTEKERYIALIANDRLRKADAIVLLEGDNLARIPEAARLYMAKWAPRVIISGGVVHKNPSHSVPASKLMPHLVQAGVPQKSIILEERSQNTREQAAEAISIAREHRWNTLIIVASHYHQYRAFLTFLKVLQEEMLDRTMLIINAPARDLPWFETRRTKEDTRFQLLQAEFDRIEEYRKKGHIADFQDAVAYQQWKESQP